MMAELPNYQRRANGATGATGATVHLIRLDKDGEIPTVKDLEEKYPGLTKQLKRGDLVEDLNESGYRSNGVFMVDLTESKEPVIVELNREFDAYGSPAITMAAISEFPLDYWDIHNMVANETYERIEQKYRTAYPQNFGNNWHCSGNQAVVAFYPDHFGLSSSRSNHTYPIHLKTIKEDDEEYIIFFFKQDDEKYMFIGSDLPVAIVPLALGVGEAKPVEVPWCVHGLSEYALKGRLGLQRLMQDNNIKREHVVVCANLDWID